MALIARQGSFCGSFRCKQIATQVRLRRWELKAVAGRAAKQKQEKRSSRGSENSSANQNGSSSSSTQTSPDSQAQSSGPENPLLPDDPIGSLSEFGAPSSSTPPDEQAANFVEEVSTGPTATTYVIWITVLLSAIGVFYGLVFAASGSLSNFLKDKVTFTRKDFVPYSERRRLEDNLMNSRQERQGAERAESGPPNEPSQPRKPQNPQSLYNLMPSPDLKK